MTRRLREGKRGERFVAVLFEIDITDLRKSLPSKRANRADEQCLG